MGARVSFGTFWMMYGRDEVKLPDNINPNNDDEVLAYIQSIFDDRPLPGGGYITDSAEIDPESIMVTIDED